MVRSFKKGEVLAAKLGTMACPTEMSPQTVKWYLLKIREGIHKTTRIHLKHLELKQIAVLETRVATLGAEPCR